MCNWYVSQQNTSLVSDIYNMKSIQSNQLTVADMHTVVVRPYRVKKHPGDKKKMCSSWLPYYSYLMIIIILLEDHSPGFIAVFQDQAPWVWARLVLKEKSHKKILRSRTKNHA